VSLLGVRKVVLPPLLLKFSPPYQGKGPGHVSLFPCHGQKWIFPFYSNGREACTPFRRNLANREKGISFFFLPPPSSPSGSGPFFSEEEGTFFWETFFSFGGGAPSFFFFEEEPPTNLTCREGIPPNIPLGLESKLLFPRIEVQSFFSPERSLFIEIDGAMNFRDFLGRLPRGLLRFSFPPSGNSFPSVEESAYSPLFHCVLIQQLPPLPPPPSTPTPLFLVPGRLPFFEGKNSSSPPPILT